MDDDYIGGHGNPLDSGRYTFGTGGGGGGAALNFDRLIVD
jgi:hypothetical protein